MKLWLVLLFLVVPLVEFWIVIQVSERLGLLPTIAILIFDSLLGAYLVRREGMGAMRRIREQLGRAKAPTDSVIDGVLIISAGALMLTPGFLTDIVGLLLLFPPTRIPLRKVLKARFAGSFGLAGSGPAGAFMHGQVFGDDSQGPTAPGPGFGGTGPSTRGGGPGGSGPVGGPGAGGRVPFGFGGPTRRGDFIDGDIVDRSTADGSAADGSAADGAGSGEVIDAESWEEPPDNPRLRP